MGIIHFKTLSETIVVSPENGVMLEEFCFAFASEGTLVGHHYVMYLCLQISVKGKVDNFVVIWGERDRSFSYPNLICPDGSPDGIDMTLTASDADVGQGVHRNVLELPLKCLVFPGTGGEVTVSPGSTISIHADKATWEV